MMDVVDLWFSVAMSCHHCRALASVAVARAGCLGGTEWHSPALVPATGVSLHSKHAEYR